VAAQVYNQPAVLLDSKSSFAPALKAAEKKLLEVLGDLEVHLLVMWGISEDSKVTALPTDW
jgi:hypothetical protein